MRGSVWAAQVRWLGTMSSKSGGQISPVPQSVTCGTGTHLYALLQVAEDSGFHQEGLSTDDRIWQRHVHKEGLNCSEARGGGKAKPPPSQAEHLDFPLCSNSRHCD